MTYLQKKKKRKQKDKKNTRHDEDIFDNEGTSGK